jgi:hypothetical protein
MSDQLAEIEGEVGAAFDGQILPFKVETSGRLSLALSHASPSSSGEATGALAVRASVKEAEAPASLRRR